MHAVTESILPADVITQLQRILTRSYAPYSHFRLAAAVKAKNVAEIFYGCNIENASFGATICAERSAISGLISACGKVELEWVVVMNHSAAAVPPCGICSQVIAEFGSDDCVIYLANNSEIVQKRLLKDVLPDAFRKFT